MQSAVIWGRVIGPSKLRGNVGEKCSQRSHIITNILDRVKCVAVAFDCFVKCQDTSFKVQELINWQKRSREASGCSLAGQKEALTDRQYEK